MFSTFFPELFCQYQKYSRFRLIGCWAIYSVETMFVLSIQLTSSIENQPSQSKKFNCKINQQNESLESFNFSGHLVPRVESMLKNPLLCQPWAVSSPNDPFFRSPIRVLPKNTPKLQQQLWLKLKLKLKPWCWINLTSFPYNSIWSNCVVVFPLVIERRQYHTWYHMFSCAPYGFWGTCIDWAVWAKAWKFHFIVEVEHQWQSSDLFFFCFW